MTVSLCLIVRNETAYLRGCVESARPFVDQIVIVDTGSTDDTIAMGWELADAFCEVPFDGDFSAARNEALVRADGDWILFLDADERVIASEGKKLLEFIDSVDEQVLGARLLRYNFFATGTFYTGRELKLFRNDGRIAYRRKINESVAASIAEAGGTVTPAPVVMNHFGHCRPIADREAKAYRYLSLMEDQLREKPQDALLVGYKALIKRTLGHFEEAAELSDRSLALDDASPIVWLFRGHVLRSLGKDGEALEAYQKGLDVDPGNAALHNMAGVELMVLGQHADAGACFTRARECDPQSLHTDINQGLLAQAAGDWHAAIACFQRAGDANPGFYHEEWAGRVERDPYRAFYAETPLGYAGLGYHLGYCRERANGSLPSSGR
ncbi:glycosyltransferase [Streptomyces hainanensis]|uniref:Glycosyltransferase n=1 Tax=Streptomyces hainanensis TaxID=402648 RepID=A0A4R4TQJ7_9ACTN|nr:glycosyltransferase family 2 protein [Streptomyces hainanensis]TDC79026.1 glycosyltransferase [Streptomyces hainanensis]